MEPLYVVLGVLFIFIVATVIFLFWQQSTKNATQNLILSITEIKADLERQIQQSQTMLADHLERKFESNQKMILDQDFRSRQEIGEGLKTVNGILTNLNQDLGAVAELSGSLTHLSRILSNTARRGAFGEAQLSAIVKDYFTAGQIEENWTIPGTLHRVEMAIRVPRTNGEEIYMPIDAKFNLETFGKYIEAREKGEETKVLKDAFLSAVRKQVKEVSSKYILTPFTTEFALIFIPIESIYQEIMSNSSLVESAYNSYKVNIVGPTNLLAVLAAYQMGYKQIAITENSRKVYDLLVGVKQQFEKFEDTLDKAIAQNETVGKTLTSLRITRLNQVKRNLDQVDGLKLSA